MTPLTAATPKPLVTHTLTRTETHSHTLIPTHLSGGFEIELGLGANTPNNYLCLLRLVIHFPWIRSHLFFFLPPSILFLSCYTFSPSSPLLPHRWRYLPLRALGQNATIQRSCFWFTAADARHTMTDTLRQMNTIFLSSCAFSQCSALKCVMFEDKFLKTKSWISQALQKACKKQVEFRFKIINNTKMQI